MATNSKSSETQADFREEIDELRIQVNELVQVLKAKGGGKTA